MAEILDESALEHRAVAKLERDLVVMHHDDVLSLTIHPAKLAKRCPKRQREPFVCERRGAHYGGMSLLARLALRLSDRDRTVLDATSSRPCGVLLAMLPVADGYEILYTLRSEQLPNHKGQVAFPGGKHAPGDGTLMDTALREAHEEVGITPTDVRVLGCLDDVYTMATDYVITPYVGLLPASYTLNANPHEVSEMFTVSIGDLRNPEYHGVADRHWRGQSFPVDVITAGPHVIWGATHSMTTNLIECLGEFLD